MAKKAPNNSIGQFIEKSPIAKVFTIIAGTIAFTGSIIYWFVSNRYEVKIENLQNTLSSIERRFSSEAGIDLSKLILQSVDDKSTSESNFFTQDSFFSKEDPYWNYKYTSPIEIMFIKNNERTPKDLVDNPMDMPIHFWCGGDDYKVTSLCDCEPTEFTPFQEGVDISPLNGTLFYRLMQRRFQTYISVQPIEKETNSEKIRSTEAIDSVLYSINISDIPKSEAMGRFLEREMGIFFTEIASEFVSKEVISVSSKNNYLHARFLTTYKNIEINDVNREKFFVHYELIILNTAKKLYLVKLESPSLTPKMNKNSAAKINEWLSHFAVIEN